MVEEILFALLILPNIIVESAINLVEMTERVLKMFIDFSLIMRYNYYNYTIPDEYC